MSALQGSNETQEAIERFAGALRQRIGADRFRLWFTHAVDFNVEYAPDGNASVEIQTTSPFAAERITKNLSTELRAAAMASIGDRANFRVSVREVETPPEVESTRVEPQRDESAARDTAPRERARPRFNTYKRSTNKLADVLKDASSVVAKPGDQPKRDQPKRDQPRRDQSRASQSDTDQFASDRSSSTGNRRVSASSNGPAASRRDSTANLPPLPESQPTAGRTLDSFLTGDCNDFAFSAATMALATPEIATPLFLHGPTGTGKSHLLAALAHEFRSRRRMRRVILLTAEQFTNDFITSVSSTGLPAFRRRYRDVDALLIDDVHFLAAKTATLREALYTVESLSAAGKPLVFTANLPPADIRGLTGEVAGRMSSGLVCPLMMLDPPTRLKLLQRLVKTRCVLDCDEGLLGEVAELVSGDARAITGVANLIGMLQRMYRREPTIDEIRKMGGDLLRNTRTVPTLRTIERAVCDAFGIESDGLKGKAQTRRISEPRTLAMYLARQHTGSAFTEIAKHFGRRSHSGAIAARTKVEGWLSSGKPIGDGDAAMPARDAIARIEARLRVG